MAKYKFETLRTDTYNQHVVAAGEVSALDADAAMRGVEHHLREQNVVAPSHTLRTSLQEMGD